MHSSEQDQGAVQAGKPICCDKLHSCCRLCWMYGRQLRCAGACPASGSACRHQGAKHSACASWALQMEAEPQLHTCTLGEAQAKNKN